MKTIAIMQPTYMPWLGYFAMIDQVDIFIFLDDVQLVKRSWQVRNKIKSQDNELLLSIPIIKKSSREDMLICNTMYVQENNWQEKHLLSIKHSYSKALYFNDVYNFLIPLYQKEYSSIGEFTSNLIIAISRKIGIRTEFIFSSKIKKNKAKKDELLSNICIALGADNYLSAYGSAEYIEEYSPGGNLVKHGIDVFYQNYTHPSYKQLGNAFILHIGVYDLLFNEGFTNSLKIIRSGNLKPIHYTSFRQNMYTKVYMGGVRKTRLPLTLYAAYSRRNAA